MKTKKIRLLIVDDHFVVILGLSGLIQEEPDMALVAEASNGPQALELYRQHRPDVVLMDNRLPGQSGAETVAQLRREFPDARVLMLSVDEGEEDIHRALAAGALGYLSKNAGREELARAIRAVAAGERYLPPPLAARLAQREPQSGLTPRELEVLELVSKGLTNREVAHVLGCAERTAKWHLENVLHKLGVANRAEALRAAAERGILHMDSAT